MNRFHHKPDKPDLRQGTFENRVESTSVCAGVCVLLCTPAPPCLPRGTPPRCVCVASERGHVVERVNPTQILVR
jgi:hypothetical protein